MSSSGLSRRRGGGGGGSDSAYSSPANSSGPSGSSGASGSNGLRRNSTSDKVVSDPRDQQMEDENRTQPKLTLMEEVLLLGLKDKQ
ncbi:hypothetical protein BGZ93_003430, partial [Podila epicladia]